MKTGSLTSRILPAVYNSILQICEPPLHHGRFQIFSLKHHLSEDTWGFRKSAESHPASWFVCAAMETVTGMYCRHTNSPLFVIADKGEVRSSNYNLIAADLRNVASLEEALKGAGFDPRWAGRFLGSSFQPPSICGFITSPVVGDPPSSFVCL